MIALRLLAVFFGCWLCAGCAYRLGPTSTMNIRNIAVPNFTNKTYTPRFNVVVTDAIIKRFQTDGSIKVVSEEGADATLTGELTDWRRVPLRFNRQDVLAPNEYRVTVIAHVVLTDNRNGKRLIDGSFVGTTFYFFRDDLEQAERQAMPLLADDLAKRITDAIIDAW